jgi:hypothetical protein
MKKISRSAPDLANDLFPVGLIPQTGMPSVYHSRSKEISMSYDALIG